MSWPVVEVVIGLTFFFWLMSVLASAINEAIANIFSMRAKGLEQGISRMLGDVHVAAFFDTAIVLSQRKPGKLRKPSYLGASIFTDALQELFGAADSSFRLDLAKVEDPKLRKQLEQFAAKVGNDAARFRKELEGWFDHTMDRASGWYKRRSQLILFIIGLSVAALANLSPVTVGQRLWNDSNFRSIVTAEATQAVASATPSTSTQSTTAGAPASSATTVPGTTPQPMTTDGSAPSTVTSVAEQGGTGTTLVVPGPLERAENEFRRINALGFPGGWGEDNAPHGAGWFAALFGWLIAAFAVTIGAPFWFDVLGKLARIRGAGPVPPPGDEVSTATNDTSSTKRSSAGGLSAAVGPSGPAIVDRMKPDQRAVVVVSATSIGTPGRFASLYKALDIAGPSIAVAQLKGSYVPSIEILSRDECTRAAIVNALVAAAENAQAVDLVLMVHGEPDELILANGSGGTVHVAATDLASDVAVNAGIHDKLRLCYSTACYGSTHADALLGAGFTAVVGAKGVNSNSATELPILLKHWTRGDTIADALRHADDPVLRRITDTVARLSFPDADSQKVLFGDVTITIDSRSVHQ